MELGEYRGCLPMFGDCGAERVKSCERPHGGDELRGGEEWQGQGACVAGWWCVTTAGCVW